MNDLLLGHAVLKEFSNYSSLNVQKIIDANAFGSKSQTQKDIFVDGLGAQFRNVLDEDYSKLEDAMKNLARVAGSQIPRLKDFSRAMTDEALNTSTLDAVSFVGIGIAKQIGSGAQAIGDQVIETGKLLTLLLPVAIIGGLYLYGKKFYDRV